MKRIFLQLLGLSLVLSLSSCGYNSMVQKQETVDQAWSQVENVYQRRADLIPNLVSTVKGAANFEQETLTQVIEARASATSINLSADDLTPENMARFEQAQQQLSGALSRLLVVSENYPDLKANQNFRDLQVQLEGTENRIAVERRNFNQTVQEYNTYIRQFPRNITANIFGFDTKAYFQATPGSDRPPTVEF
ncbi:LemA protein [Catalinimonas alkaloidigena]|uniref:LemA protein n=1 Tax=Catalinimonas alkaloidigena TaxID=1075417 RepID=A0A1G9EFR7_9BACT|nr:LemA family protein [Catalinimonas alkaloidigena]SDK74875.1 LemA protein [Catalinimonas alkaloidigena]